MDIATAHTLTDLTTQFYETCAQAFSATRHAPWEGWERLLSTLSPLLDEDNRCEMGALYTQRPTPICVLDLACGNMRFEKFLREKISSRDLQFFAYDTCAMPAVCDVPLMKLDLIDALDKGALAQRINNASFDLGVAFGILHHIPLAAWRYGLLCSLIDCVRPGGIVAVSFWQFMHDERLAKKARATTPVGCARYGIELDEESHDYLLGWQDSNEVFRYCHHFDDVEIAHLIEDILSAYATSGLRVVDEYDADGRSGALNHYVVFQKRL